MSTRSVAHRRRRAIDYAKGPNSLALKSRDQQTLSRGTICNWGECNKTPQTCRPLYEVRCECATVSAIANTCESLTPDSKTGAPSLRRRCVWRLATLFGGIRRAAVNAFETLYERHKDYVLRVAYRYMSDADLALDVLQDTFSYVLKKFPPTGTGLTLSSKLQTLLYVAAKNSALSMLRKSSRAGIAGDVDPDQLPAPGYRDSGDLAALLRGLSPGQREIITLRFVDDHSLKDIGAMLDIPVGTVKSRLHKAVQAMRKSPYVRDFFEK